MCIWLEPIPLRHSMDVDLEPDCSASRRCPSHYLKQVRANFQPAIVLVNKESTNSLRRGLICDTGPAAPPESIYTPYTYIP